MVDQIQPVGDLRKFLLIIAECVDVAGQGAREIAEHAFCIRKGALKLHQLLIVGRNGGKLPRCPRDLGGRIGLAITVGQPLDH